MDVLSSPIMTLGQSITYLSLSLSFLKVYSILIQKRGRQREILMGERNIDQLLPTCTLTGDRTHNTGMCLDQKSNCHVVTG